MHLVLWMLRLYPPAWRERYETEMVALLEQHEITLWTVFASPFFVNMSGRFSPDWYAFAFWIVFSCIYVTPALLLKRLTGQQQADRVTEPPRNGLSPKVWIMVLPVLFLVFCMQWEFVVADDNSNFGDVLIAWLLPSLASLIILLVMKLGSRKSTDLPTKDELILHKSV